MAIKETLEFTDEVEKKDNLIAQVDERVVFVDEKISDHFRETGFPDPSEFLETTRTLKSVFAVEEMELSK